MLIRQATRDDSALLAQLIREAFHDVAIRFGLTEQNCPTHPSNCRKEWVDSDLSSGKQYFLLEVEGRPVGCVALERADRVLYYLERLAVLPEERRKGYGKELVLHALRTVRGLSGRRISIGIIDSQSELKAWYENLGFRATGTREFARLPFAVGYMECDLQAISRRV